MSDASYQLTTLDNGLPVIRVPLKGPRSATVLVLANTGSRYEKREQYGLAHFFEHLVFKGTRNYPDPQFLARTIDGIGADFNAFTGKEYTGYYVKSASKHLGLALDVVSDMILAPLLRAEDIEREKGVIIEELNLYHDTPQRHVHDLFAELSFAKPGLSHQIIGTKKSIEEMKPAKFVEFLRQWYGLPNLVLIVAGDAEQVMAAKTLEQITAAFNKKDGLVEINGSENDSDRIDHKVQTKEKLQQEAEQAKIFAKQRLKLESREIQQAHFVLAWPAYDRHQPQRYAQLLLANIVGSNMSSRLFTEVREKRGLAYYVKSELSTYHETGFLGAAAGVDPERIEEALEVTINQFKPAVTEDELQRAKEYVAGRLALSHEDSQSVAQYYGVKQLLRNEIQTPEESLAELRAVELDEVQAVIEELIQPDKLRLALIGPYEDQKRFEQFI